MIEMLAVLAIMGILTVGGIAAYSFAVSKHRANQIYNQVDLRAVTAFSNPIVRQTQTGKTFFLPGFDDTFENLPYEHSKIGNAAFQIKVTDVPRKVCRRLQDMTFKLPRQVTLNGEDISSACGSENTFVFVYDGLSVGKPSSGVTPIDCDCSGCQSCETGTCQDNDNLCGPKEICQNGSCVCAPDYTECRGGCYTTCADGLIRDPISCDCVCEAQECPDHAVWDNDTCACVCDSPLIYDQDSHSCKCPTDAPYYFEEANLCCKSGYTPIDGVCQKIDCRGGPTNYNCYINDIQCGYNCNAQGRECGIGICYADYCQSDEVFGYMQGQPYAYRCQKQIDDILCTNYYEDRRIFACFKNNQLCMQTDSNLVQSAGTCDEMVCQNILSSASLTYLGDSLTTFGSCLFDENFICYPTRNYTKWNCLQYGYLCGTGCSDPFNCGSCEMGCPDNMIYNSETGYCEDPDMGIYCTTTNGAYYQDCYQKDTDKRCELRTNFNTVKQGSCTDPGCPAGFEYQYIAARDLFGCQETGKATNEGMACIYDTGGIQCSYNGIQCGIGCDYDGTDCGSVYLPQCALAGHCPQTGYDMSDGCTCDGNVTSVDGTNYCCPAGHTYVNGACTMTG